MWRIVRPRCSPVSQFCLRSWLTVGDRVEQHVLLSLNAANIASNEEDSNGNASPEGLGASQILLKSVQQCRTRKYIHLLVNTCQDKFLAFVENCTLLNTQPSFEFQKGNRRRYLNLDWSKASPGSGLYGQAK